jgi:hypothetical protein
MRVIQRDVMKLRQGEQLERRMALEEERLQFAVERFEEEKQTDERRAMVGFLAAARQWPEVQEALAVAFRMFQERKGAKTEGNKAELNPIKVNQGEKQINQEQMQAGLEGCSPSWRHSQPQRACCAGRVCRSATNSTSHGRKRGYGLQEGGAISTTMGGVRMNGNLTKLKPIKVDQGDVLRRELHESTRIGADISLPDAAQSIRGRGRERGGGRKGRTCAGCLDFGGKLARLSP